MANPDWDKAARTWDQAFRGHAEHMTLETNRNVSTNLQATDAATARCCSNTCISGTASYSNIRTPLAVAHNVAVVLEALTEPEAGVGTESVTMGGWRVVLEQT